MQIKVKDTKMLKVNKPIAFYRTINNNFVEIPVAEGKLVLILDKNFKLEFTDSSINYDLDSIKPIIISETEKIEVDDKFLVHIKDNVGHESHNKIFTCKEIGNTGVWSVELDKESIFYNQNVFKILALPEHFSPKHLQAIVDGRMKHGDKVLVECDEKIIKGDLDSIPKRWFEIKLNQPKYRIDTNHITLHKVEEKMYTREEVRRIVYSFPETFEGGHCTIDRMNQWFEQNVK